MSTKKINYISKYNTDNYKMYQFRVKRSNSDLIDKLDNIPNRNKYITDLIKKDINPSILTIKQIKERIKPIIEKYNIKEVCLFGSYARGEANRNSDVDIYCESGNADTLIKLSVLKREIKEALQKDVDIVTFDSTIDSFFKEQLDKDKIKIFEKE